MKIERLIVTLAILGMPATFSSHIMFNVVHAIINDSVVFQHISLVEKVGSKFHSQVPQKSLLSSNAYRAVKVCVKSSEHHQNDLSVGLFNGALLDVAIFP